MNKLAVIAVLLAAGQAFAVSERPDSRSMEVAERVRVYLKSDDVFEGGTFENGTAVYNAHRDLAFYVEGKTIYAVNERAKQAAPDLPAAPATITYEAVYEGSSTSELFRGLRPTDMAMHGHDLPPQEVEKLEALIQEQPGDLWARTVLLGYYFTRHYQNEEIAKKREATILWLVEHAPESEVLTSPYAQLDPFAGKGAYTPAVDVMKMMKDHVAKDPENVRLLANAAEFFRFTDRAFASECLRKCTQLQPDNAAWHQKLADSLQSQHALGIGGGAVDANAAKEALAEQELALAMTTDPMERMDLIGRLADSAFDAGDNQKARDYANQVFDSLKTVNKWAHDNFTHAANTVLGRIALKEGDVAAAKKFLLTSATFNRTPQFSPVGPRLDLANELLDKGEKEVVLEYYELMGKVWSKKIADVWIADVKNGRKPRADTAIMMMMQDDQLMDAITGEAGPVDWQEPLIVLPLASRALQKLDIVYGLPLLALVGVVLLVRLFSSRQHLWILAPLLFIYAVPLSVFKVWPELTERLFGLHWSAMQHLLSTYFGSLAVLWLLSDLLARMKWWGRLPAAFVIMGGAAVLGAVNYPYRYHIISEVSAFVIVVVASFAVAGLCCSKRYAAGKFLAFLFACNVVFMLIVWPVIWACRMSVTFGEPAQELAEWLPRHIVIALIDGVGLFVLLIPFFLVASFVPLYKQQFRRVLNLRQT